jgi:predicted DNA-binding transcriptional regulator AlpA
MSIASHPAKSRSQRKRDNLIESSQLFVSVPGAVQLDRLLTVDELAALRGLNRFTVYHMTRLAGQGALSPGALPPIRRVGNRLFFLASEVNSWLQTLGNDNSAPRATSRRPGRPTKSQVVARRAVNEVVEVQ